ncbi:MAG TPA: FHA domain-containing protein [Polyangiaceae bacterium]|nr:FHA domain-containing protein [Polyangiaceae bacterium]
MASKRKRFDPMGGLRAPPTPDPDDDEPGPTLEDQFQRLEQARKTIEATFWYLEVEAPESPPFRQGLLGKRFVIGRDATANLPLRGAGISRQHALLEHDEERDCWLISDAGSHNGTYVNGRRVREPTLLGPADTIHVGDWRLRLRADSNEDRRELLRFATLRMQTPALPGVGGRPPTPKPDRLVVISGPAPRKEIRLDEGPVRLGPVKGSSLVPRGGALAELDLEVRPLPEPGSYELVVRSEAGPPVVVNEAPVRKLRLSPGDRLRLGQGGECITLEFRAGDPAPKRRTGPPAKGEAGLGGVPDAEPSSEATPTETKRIDVEAFASAARAADDAARQAERGRAGAPRAGARPGAAPGAEAPGGGADKAEAGAGEAKAGAAPPRGGPTGAAPPPGLFVKQADKPGAAPWASKRGRAASPPGASPPGASPPAASPREDDPTPEPTRSLPARPAAAPAPKRRALVIAVAVALGALGLLAAALTRLQGGPPRGENVGPPPEARTRASALEPHAPPSAPSAVEAPPRPPESASAAPPAPAPVAPSGATPANGAAPSGEAAPPAAPRPRPAPSGKRGPRGPGREAADPESEARMREFLCRQKGKCD